MPDLNPDRSGQKTLIFKKSQRISLFILVAVLSFDSTRPSHASIPFNRDFPDASYPYAKAPNGCGPTGIFGSTPTDVRDTWGPVNFKEACNQHDKCYYTEGSSWNNCNERFYSQLRSACESDLRIPVRVPDPTLNDPLRTRKTYLPPEPVSLTACYTIATAYYTAVQGGVALGVFKEAQDLQKRYNSWIATLASNYQLFRLQTGTGLGETNDQWSFAALPNGDLMGIKKNATGTGRTEVHILAQS